MDVSFSFHGGKELQAALNELPKTIERKIGRQALRAGAKVLAKSLRASVPVDLLTQDGIHLKDSIVVFRPRATRANMVIRVAYKGGAKLYGKRIEFGDSTRRPQPIWRRTISVDGKRVMQVVIDKLALDLIKEVDRLAKKSRFNSRGT